MAGQGPDWSLCESQCGDTVTKQAKVEGSWGNVDVMARWAEMCERDPKEKV